MRESDSSGQPGDAAPAVPAGVKVSRGEDGSILLDLPVSREKFLRWFAPLFSLPFMGAGVAILLGEGNPVGFAPFTIGAFAGWFGAYTAFGRLEFRLGPERLEWNRVFLKRWRTHAIERATITGITTSVGVRTNGRPTSWRLHLAGSGSGQWGPPALPGFYPEDILHWMGGILATWSQSPYVGKLDRSHRSD